MKQNAASPGDGDRDKSPGISAKRNIFEKSASVRELPPHDRFTPPHPMHDRFASPVPPPKKTATWTPSSVRGVGHRSSVGSLWPPRREDAVRGAVGEFGNSGPQNPFSSSGDARQEAILSSPMSVKIKAKTWGLGKPPDLDFDAPAPPPIAVKSNGASPRRTSSAWPPPQSKPIKGEGGGETDGGEGADRSGSAPGYSRSSSHRSFSSSGNGRMDTVMSPTTRRSWAPSKMAEFSAGSGSSSGPGGGDPPIPKKIWTPPVSGVSEDMIPSAFRTPQTTRRSIENRFKRGELPSLISSEELSPSRIKATQKLPVESHNNSRWEQGSYKPKSRSPTMEGELLCKAGGSIIDTWKDAVAKSKSRASSKDNRPSEMSPQVPVAARRTVFEVVLDMDNMEEICHNADRFQESQIICNDEDSDNGDNDEDLQPEPVEGNSKRTSDVTDVDDGTDETDTLPGDGISEAVDEKEAFEGTSGEEDEGEDAEKEDDEDGNDSEGDSDFDSREGEELILDGSVGSFVSDLPSSSDDESYQPKRTSYRIRYDGPTNLPIDRYKPPPLPNHDERFESDIVARDGPSLPSRTYDRQPSAPSRPGSGESDHDDDASTIASQDSCNRPDVFITPMEGITETNGMWTVKRVWALEEADKDELEHTCNNSQLFNKIRTLVGAPEETPESPSKDGAPKLPTRTWRVAKVKEPAEFDLDAEMEEEEEMTLQEDEMQEGIKTFVVEAAKEEVEIVAAVAVHEEKREERRRLKLERTKSKRWGHKKKGKRRKSQETNGIQQTGYFVKQPSFDEASEEKISEPAESEILIQKIEPLAELEEEPDDESEEILIQKIEPLAEVEEEPDDEPEEESATKIELEPVPKPEPAPELQPDPPIDPEPEPELPTSEVQPEPFTELESITEPEPVPELTSQEPKGLKDKKVGRNGEKAVNLSSNKKPISPVRKAPESERRAGNDDISNENIAESKPLSPVRRVPEEKKTVKKIFAKPVITRTKKKLIDPAKSQEQTWWKGTQESSSSEESSFDGSDGSSSASASVSTDEGIEVPEKTGKVAEELAAKAADGPDYWWNNHKPGDR